MEICGKTAIFFCGYGQFGENCMGGMAVLGNKIKMIKKNVDLY